MSLAVLEMLSIFPPALFACWSVAAVRVAKKPVPRRYLWKHLFLALIALTTSFGVGGFISSYRIEHATRIHIQGVIQNLENHEGKSSSTTFQLFMPDHNRTPELSSRYAADHLQNGDLVDVIYLTDFNEVLSLTKSNASSGWSFTRSDGIGLAHFCEGLGILLLLSSLAMATAWISSPKNLND